MNKAIFTKNFETATITVVREFDAPVEKVWRAWTTVSELEKWWAPLPYKAVTKTFDFSVGGFWHYYMQSPEGEKSWCFMGFDSIIPLKTISAVDAFCDDEMNILPDMPKMRWTNEYEGLGERTRVTVTTVLESKEDLEKMVTMGFEEGFSMGLNQLENLLAQS